MQLRHAVLIAAILALAAGGADARHRHRKDWFDAPAAPAVAGDFSYYVLALSWSPVFCESHGSDPQCNTARPAGFVLHGLWPQGAGGEHPQHCSTDQRLDGAARDLGRQIFPTEGLMAHEWNTHGTCSGMTALDYFRTAQQAVAGIRLPAAFAPGPRVSHTGADAIEAAFLAANPRLGRRAVTVNCAQHELVDVRVCLDRRLNPVDCGTGVQNSCGRGDVVVPGVR